MPELTEFKELQKAYIICGDEEYIRQKAVGALIRRLGFNMPELNHMVLEKAKAQEIITACETLPFMDEKRLVQVKGDFLKDDAKPLEDYIPKLPETTVLLIDVQGKPDKRRRLYKLVEKLGGVREYARPAFPRLVEMLCAEARERGLALTKDLAETLIRQSGQDLALLCGELDKLSAVARGGRVTGEDIRQYAARSLEYDVFALHNLFMQGRTAEGLALLDQVTEAEKSPFGVIGLVAMRFRLILKARAMMDAKYDMASTVSALGVHPYAAKEAMNDAKKFTAEALRRKLKSLAALDYKLKSGQGGRVLTETVFLELYRAK